jgi:hypothetical protein
MDKMRLIREFTEDLEVFSEGKDSPSLFIRGITLQSDLINKNGRLYPDDVMSEAIDKHRKEFLESGRAMGELNHPDTNTARIDLKNVSHKFVEVKKEGNNYITKAKILEGTPNGDIVKNLLKNEVKLGISSRGLGNLKESEGKNVVQKFHIISLGDIVADPSAPDAFVQGVMEDKEWVIENGVLVGKNLEQDVDEYKKIINEAKSKDIQKVTGEIILDYFKKLTK